MKSREEYEKFTAEVRALCERHGIYMVGTCEGEGIYGEITLFDPRDESKSSTEDIRRAFNFEAPDESGRLYRLPRT